MLSETEFDPYLDSIQHEAFRLEALPAYAVPVESAGLKRLTGNSHRVVGSEHPPLAAWSPERFVIWGNTACAGDTPDCDEW